jgi:MFS family permease
MFVMSPVAARLTAARGPRTSLILGGAIITLAFALATLPFVALWQVLLVSTMVGVGVGFAYSAMPTLIMRAVPPSETAASNGLNSVMRTLGSTAASALIGIVLATNLVTVGGVTTTSTLGFQLSFAVSAAAGVVGLAIALFIPRRHALPAAALPD